jgi:hypothetical protein
MTDFDVALRRYRGNRFVDRDITRCTGMSLRAWREAIKRKAVRTVQSGRGRGRVRVCDATNLKRAAVISALNQTGLSLDVAGQIALFVPFHTLLYTICDPLVILCQRSAEIDPRTGLPPRMERPVVNWFDLLTPASADAETDWAIEIFENRFVGVRYDSEAVIIFGDLRQQARCFVAWLPFPRRDQFANSAISRIAQSLVSNDLLGYVAENEDPTRWTKKTINDLHRSGYRLEHHGDQFDSLRVAAAAAVRSPVFQTTINISLAIRKALRRYLGIEPAAPGDQTGELE